MSGSINLILGGSGYGKSDRMFKEVIEKSMANPGKNYIIVVPEQFTMATQKEIVKRHPNHGVMNIDIVSFNRLAFRVFEELGINNLSILDDTGKTLILRKVIEDNRDGLLIYGGKVNQPGFVEQMKSVISELYSYGIEMDNLDSIIGLMQDRPYVSRKLSDIRLIYSRFKETINEKYITKEEILKKLCGEIGRSEIVKNSEFFLDGFTGFTPIQNRLLKLLLELNRDITVLLTIDSAEAQKLTEAGFKNIKEQELFNLSKTTINKLFDIAARCHVSIGRQNVIILPENGNIRHRNNEELSMLEKNLFRHKDVKIDNSESIKIQKFLNPLAECEAVATYINKCVMESGYRYRDFAVITGAVDLYRENIINMFSVNNIPVFMDNKRSLILNPAVASLRAAMEMIDMNFTYESVFKFLRCNVSGMERDDIDILENYVLEYGIRGYQNFSIPFTRWKIRKNASHLENINKARQNFVDIISEFREQITVRNASVRQMSLAVYNFMEKLDFYNTLNKYTEEFKNAGKQDLAKEYEQTYGQIIGLLDKLVELMGDSVIPLKEYRRLLDAGFEEIKVGVIPLGVDSVVVGDMDRTRLNDVKVLFVLGVNDGIIPNTAKDSGLLTQRDRGLLKKLDVELSPGSRENIFIQKFYLYQNLTKPSDRLILTYSETGADGKKIRPSYLINNILEMCKNPEIAEKKDTGINIYTTDMGLKYLANNFINVNDQPDKLIKELFSYFYRDEKLKNKLMKIVDGAYFTTKTGRLQQAVTNAIYGNQVVKSPTRLEKYAACAYAHFLKYGLQLAQRKVFEIGAADIGTTYHSIIEQFSREMKEQRLNFRTITDEQRESLLDLCMEKVKANLAGEAFLSTKRNEYLLSRIREVSNMTLWAISEHIKAGNFNPEEFELSFRDGRVDRVDSMDIDGRYYVKIIDYKTGKKAFDMVEMMNGLQIQLIYYMDQVMEIEQQKNKEKTVLPGGAFYFNIKSPFIDRVGETGNDMTNKEFRDRFLESYMMTGLINSSSDVVANMDRAFEQENGKSIIIPIKASEINAEIGRTSLDTVNYNRMVEYVRNSVERMCDEILSGNIEANPYKRGDVTPCRYCEYKGMCNFNEKYAGNKFRTLAKFKPEDVIEKEGEL